MKTPVKRHVGERFLNLLVNTSYYCIFPLQHILVIVRLTANIHSVREDSSPGTRSPDYTILR